MSLDGNKTFIKYSIIFTVFIVLETKPNAKIRQIIVLDINP